VSASANSSPQSPQRDPVWNPARWLPTTRDEVLARGWDELDVIIVSGDAYVDHPAFGTAVIGRMLEAEGLRVAIIAQPNWRDDLRDFKKLGAPRLFFGVTSGCMDSMVNHYTAAKKLRSEDAYTPGGEHGFRPDYATTVYSKILKDLFPDVPVMIGGIEASLRRVTHFDYWSNKLMPSILADSRADLLIYGMGELPLKECVRLLKRGVPFSSLTQVAQTAYLLPPGQVPPKNKNWDDIALYSHEECEENREHYSKNFKNIETESNRVKARRILQQTGEQILVVNPPYPVMTEAQIDTSFDLPYTRLPHPKYRKRGLRDDQAFHQHAPRVFWRMQLLHHLRAPGEIRRVAQQGEHPARGGSHQDDARLPRHHQRPRRTVGEHVSDEGQAAVDLRRVHPPVVHLA
jgi:uncharacterized radical SAM protein YgiQ